jgi:hypothetical protein
MFKLKKFVFVGPERGRRWTADFSKENCSSETYLADFKMGEIARAGFRKLTLQLQETGFLKLPANSKAFGNRLLRSY